MSVFVASSGTSSQGGGQSGGQTGGQTSGQSGGQAGGQSGGQSGGQTGGQSGSRSGQQPQGLLAESVIWSYVVQLTSALRTIHTQGLACRVMDPTKILLTDKSR